MHTVAEDTLQLSALHTRSKMATSRTTACTQRDLQHAAHRRFCRASYTYCILCACLLVVQVPRPGAAVPLRTLDWAELASRDPKGLGPVNASATFPTSSSSSSGSPRSSSTSISGTTRKRGPRKFINEEYQPINPRAACRLLTYAPSYPRYGKPVLCDGAAAAGCVEPCAPGFTRILGPGQQQLCQAPCPQGAGNPSHFCAATLTCVAPGAPCPRAAMEVPLLCPAPHQLMGSCILQEYHSDPLPPPPVKECKGILYRDYVGRWKCSDPPQYPPCAAGYNPTVTTGAKSVGSMWPWQDRGYCRQACPAWMVDCGGSCHMPHVPCTSTSAHLCPLPPGDCRTPARQALARHTACGAEGFTNPASCPLLLHLHGGCGGSTLQLASALRKGSDSGSNAGVSSGYVKLLEAWLAAAKSPRQLLSKRTAPAAGGLGAGGVEGMGGHLLVALRLTMADNSVHVLGNTTAPSTAGPTTSYAFEEGEALTGLQLWSSQEVTDAAGLTAPIAGLQFTTTRGLEFTLGTPPRDLAPLLPQWPAGSNGQGSGSSTGGGREIDRGPGRRMLADVQMPQPPVLATSAGTASGMSTDGGRSSSSSSSSSSKPPVLVEGQLVGGQGQQAVNLAQPVIQESESKPVATAVWLPGLTLTKEQLGTGVLVGAAAFSSSSHIHSLALLILERPLQANNPEL